MVRAMTVVCTLGGLGLTCACDPGIISVEDDTVAADTVVAPDTARETIAETSVSDTADTPDVPDVPELPTESAAIARVFDGVARGFVALDGALVVADDAGWWWVDAGGRRRVSAVDMALPIAPPTAAARLDDVTVIASPEGLCLIADGVVSQTPLSASFGADPVRQIVVTPIGTWLAGAARLWRLRDGVLAPLDDLDVTDARLAAGARDTQPALWIAAAGEVYALTGSDTLQAWPELTADAASLATDRQGRVWVVAEDGTVHVRAAAWTTLDVTARSVSAHPDSDDVWLAADDALYHVVGDEVRRVTNGLAASQHAALPSGRLLALGPDGIDELAPGRVLALLGLVSGAQLTTPTTVTVRASLPDTITTVATTLDGVSVSDPWSVTLDPVALPNGSHEVGTTVLYNDGLSLQADLSFTVHFPTWDDVAALYERRCADCHDATEGASTAVLDHPAAWSERIDCIECRVSVPFDRSRPECVACQDVASSMPPTGALTPVEIALIRAWRAGNFRLE